MRAVAILLLLALLAGCQPARTLPGRPPDPRGSPTLPDPAPAQQEYASYIAGWVTDVDGYALCDISIRAKDRHHGARTNGRGYYELRLAGMSEGRIVRVIAEATGYRSVEVPVAVHRGPNRLDLMLTPVEPAEEKAVAEARARDRSRGTDIPGRDLEPR